MFSSLRVPVIVAPMAGGPSTPELVASAVESGAFGFLAGGYLSATSLTEQIGRVRRLVDGEFGVNVFVPGIRSAADTTRYARRIRETAEYHGVAPGGSCWDDDAYAAKLDVLVNQHVPVVSFTFGVPLTADIERLQRAGSTVIVTVTSPEEARQAAAAGVDGLCVQGGEAGGHRALFADDPEHPAGGQQYGTLAALRLVRDVTDMPLIASGGLVHGADVAAVISAGAVAAQLGTAFLRADEAGTNSTMRRALAEGTRQTRFTRAFTGRPARGLTNRFLREHSDHAPAAYPQLHHMTKPIRTAAAAAEDPEALSMWAGQTYPLAHAGPAAELIETLWEQAQSAFARGAQRFG